MSIHSKSKKVCGTAFSVKKIAEKVRIIFGPFWVILVPFWAFLRKVQIFFGSVGAAELAFRMYAVVRCCTLSLCHHYNFLAAKVTRMSHEDISACMHFSAFLFISLHFSTFLYNSLHFFAFFCMSACKARDVIASQNRLIKECIMMAI